jgi:hypothetical protein
MAQSFIGRQDLPIGLRNNNPGNIRPGDPWQGATGTNGGFLVFEDLSWGLRALATDIANKIHGGFDTIQEMITRYAPPSENNTAAYVAAVSRDTGIPADQLLGEDLDTLRDLIRAIISHENGPTAAGLISDQDIDQGISMMNASLLQWFNAAGIALQHPTTPGGLIVIGLIGLLLYARS